jgi:hypothetical protein
MNQDVPVLIRVNSGIADQQVCTALLNEGATNIHILTDGFISAIVSKSKIENINHFGLVQIKQRKSIR